LAVAAAVGLQVLLVLPQDVAGAIQTAWRFEVLQLQIAVCIGTCS
jgi:hypothetical protein